MASHYPPRTNHKASPGLGNTTQPDHRRLPRPVSPCFAEVSGGSKHIMLLVFYKLGPVISLTGALFPCSPHNILCNLQLPCSLAVTPPPCLQHLSASPRRSLYSVGPDDLSANQAGGEEESAVPSSPETTPPRSVFLSVKCDSISTPYIERLSWCADRQVGSPPGVFRKQKHLVGGQAMNGVGQSHNPLDTSRSSWGFREAGHFPCQHEDSAHVEHTLALAWHDSGPKQAKPEVYGRCFRVVRMAHELSVPGLGSPLSTPQSSAAPAGPLDSMRPCTEKQD